MSSSPAATTPPGVWNAQIGDDAGLRCTDFGAREHIGRSLNALEKLIYLVLGIAQALGDFGVKIQFQLQDLGLQFADRLLGAGNLGEGISPAPIDLRLLAFKLEQARTGSAGLSQRAER